SALQPEGLHRTRGVARSGLRPLPKILDCSPAEVSCQCLSASGAGRALTPARHLRLGEPLPHQLANITWAPLRAINLWSHDVIRYYPPSRTAIPNPKVGTHALLPLTPVP